MLRSFAGTWGQALKDCKEHKASFALQQAVLANIVSTGMVSLMVLDDYNCAIAHSVYYGLVLLPGFEEKYLHGDVVAYGVLVQLAVDHDMDRLPEAKKFLKDLGIPFYFKGKWKCPWTGHIWPMY